MNENAKKWVKALRSGEYNQGVNYLHCWDQFCALGVGCDLAVKDKATTMTYDPTRGIYQYDRNTTVIPKSVRNYLGLSSNYGLFLVGIVQKSMAQLNDLEHLTFSEIADIIESEPQGLFQ